MSTAKSPGDSTLLSHFSDLNDPRVDRTKRHELSDILVIAICAVICGAEGWTEVEEFGNCKNDWLVSFLDLPNGIPSHDTFGRVFARLDPEEFQRCFVSWIAAVREATDGEVVAIDGKTLRASADAAGNKAALHMVSAWASASGLTLAQIGRPAKSGELQAIAPLLKLLDISGCIVTVDAAGCYQEVARDIRAGDADYVLALKGNQPTLYADASAYFAACRERDFKNVKHSFFESVEGGHGRVETRRCWAIAPVGKIRDWENWPDLRSFILIERVRESGGQTSRSLHYYISSLEPDAEKALSTVRAHWGIENSVHWVLDVAMNEDACRIRKDHGAANFALLRRIALNLVKNEKTVKRGVKTRQRKAGWDNDYLLKVIFN